MARPSPLATLAAELGRRRVFRAAVAYAVIAWIIIQVANDVFPALQLPAWSTTLVVVLVLLGFPVAIALAWAYDVTPAGIERTTSVPPDGGPAAQAPAAMRRAGGRSGPAARRVAAGAVVLLGLSAGAFGLVQLRGGAASAHADSAEAARTVAVLPFQVRAGERLAYLGGGVVELLSADLRRTGSIDVVDPNALLSTLAQRGDAFHDPDRGREIAREFGAGMYVLGSVFEVEGRVRLTASLYDRSRGSRPVATKTVEGGIADVLALVARLATELTGSLPSPEVGVTAKLVWAGDTVDLLGSPTADGRLLSFVDWHTGNLAVRDLHAGITRRVTKEADWATSDEFAEYSRYSPNGRQIAYAWFSSSFDYELRVIDAAGGEPRTLLRSGWLQPLAWRRDGSAVLTAAWTDEAGHLIWVSVADGRPDTLQAIPRQADSFHVSPDERWLAWDLPAPNDPRQRDIHVRAADASAETTAVRHPANDVLLGWLPDARHLLFWSDRGTAPGIWALPVADGRAAGEPVEVRSNMWWVHPLGFARDAFIYGVTAGERQVHSIVIDVANAVIIEAAAPAVHAAAHSTGAPAWSEDGRRLAYISDAPGGLPLGARAVVRDVASGAWSEYPLLLYLPRIVAWLDEGSLLLTARSPTTGWGFHSLDLGTGALAVWTGLPGDGASGAVAVATAPGAEPLLLWRWVGRVAQLVRHEPATGRETVLFRAPSAGQIALSPDARHLVIANYVRAADRHEMQLIPAAGGPPRLLTASPGIANGFRSIAWSRDGRHLLYARSVDGGERQLRRLRLEDGDDRLITTAPGLTAIQAHPDGRTFAFTAGNNRREVWVLDGVTQLLR